MVKDTMKARSRDEVGSAAARRLRRAGEIPANLGGAGEAPAALAVSAYEFEQVQGAGARMVTLEMGSEQVQALIRDVQYDAFGDRVLHVDFDRVVAGQVVEVEIRVEFFGEPEETGVVLQVRTDTVEVSCLPGKIPECVEVDVRECKLGDEIRLGEIALPEGVELVSDPDEICAVLVMEAAPEEEEEELAEIGAEDKAEPEVIRRSKEEGEEAED